MKITRFELRPGQANPPGNTPPSADDYAKLRASEVRRDLEDRLAELESQLQESATNVAAPEPELVRTRARRIDSGREVHTQSKRALRSKGPTGAFGRHLDTDLFGVKSPWTSAWMFER